MRRRWKPGNVTLRTVAARMTVDRGRITVVPLSAALREGQMTVSSSSTRRAMFQWRMWMSKSRTFALGS